MNKVWTIMTAGVLSCSPLLAGGDSGLYVGAGAGGYYVDIADKSLGGNDFKESAAAGKLIAGYNIGIIPLIDVALESNYVMLSESESDDLKVDGNAVTLQALGGVNLGPVGLFVKVGNAWWNIEGSGVFSKSTNGADPAYGVGLSFKLWSFGVRAEYEMIDTSDVDVSYATLSGTYTF